MAIYRQDSEIRIERSEKKTKEVGIFGFACFAILTIYGATLVDSIGDWLWLGGIFLFGVLLTVGNFRRRNVCIIRDDQIGHGSINGRMWWFDRTPIVSVRVVDNMMVQVLCKHSDGVERESFVLHNFDPEEIRDAFREAGIPSR